MGEEIIFQNVSIWEERDGIIQSAYSISSVRFCKGLGRWSLELRKERVARSFVMKGLVVVLVTFMVLVLKFLLNF